MTFYTTIAHFAQNLEIGFLPILLFDNTVIINYPPPPPKKKKNTHIPVYYFDIDTDFILNLDPDLNSESRP